MRLDIRAFAGASAVAGMLLYSFGGLIDRLGAWGAAGIVSYIFRVEVVTLSGPFSWGALFLGIAVIGLLFGALGGIMAFAYNRLIRERVPGAAHAMAAKPIP